MGLEVPGVEQVDQGDADSWSLVLVELMRAVAEEGPLIQDEEVVAVEEEVHHHSEIHPQMEYHFVVAETMKVDVEQVAEARFHLVEVLAGQIPVEVERLQAAVELTVAGDRGHNYRQLRCLALAEEAGLEAEEVLADLGVEVPRESEQLRQKFLHRHQEGEGAEVVVDRSFQLIVEVYEREELGIQRRQSKSCRNEGDELNFKDWEARNALHSTHMKLRILRKNVSIVASI